MLEVSRQSEIRASPIPGQRWFSRSRTTFSSKFPASYWHKQWSNVHSRWLKMWCLEGTCLLLGHAVLPTRVICRCCWDPAAEVPLLPCVFSAHLIAKGNVLVGTGLAQLHVKGDRTLEVQYWALHKLAKGSQRQQVVLVLTAGRLRDRAGFGEKIKKSSTVARRSCLDSNQLKCAHCDNKRSVGLRGEFCLDVISLVTSCHLFPLCRCLR